MYVKLPLKDLNPDSYPPHPTSIYACNVTTAPKVHNEMGKFLDTPGVRRNGTLSSHIHDGPYFEFNE